MFKNRRTINLLKNEINSIKIPGKEKVLPEQALLLKRKEIGRQILRIYPLKAALACLLLIVLCMGLYLPLKYSTPPVVDNASINSNLPSINSTGTTSSDVVEEPKLVISADVYDGYMYMDGSIPSSKEIYISNTLKTKMEEYKGQDVLFRVIVDLPITQEEEQNFLDVILYESEEYAAEANRIIELKTELETYKEYIEIVEEYYRYSSDIKDNIIETPPEFEALKKEYERIKPYYDRAIEIYNEIDEIKANCFDKYKETLKSEKLEFMKNLGAVLVEPVYPDSEIRRSYFGDTDALIMNLSESMITEMAARGGFSFKLTPPDRAEGYDGKISDSLAVLLEQAQDSEEFHVAVISVLDKSNQFAYFRFASYNPEYNSNLNKEWQGELTNERIKEFIDNISIRNNIVEKRVTDGKYLDFQILNLGYENPSINSAGFEANLTKEQLLALVADHDVKVIYPMDVYDTDDYVNGDA